MAASAHESPAADEWRDGGVESAAGFLVQSLRMLQQGEKGRRHPDWLAGGQGIEVSNFAGMAIKAELGLEPLDFVQRFLARRAQRNRIVAMQHQLESGRHGVAGESYRGHGGWSGGVMEEW